MMIKLTKRKRSIRAKKLVKLTEMKRRRWTTTGQLPLSNCLASLKHDFYV